MPVFALSNFLEAGSSLASSSSMREAVRECPIPDESAVDGGTLKGPFLAVSTRKYDW